MGKNIIKIKTEHAQQIKTLIEVIKEVFEDVNMEIKRDTSKNGEEITCSEEEKKKRGHIKMQVINREKTMMVRVKLKSESFSKFYCSEKKRVIGVSLGYLHKALKSAEREENLTFFIRRKQENKLIVRRDNEEKNKRVEDIISLSDLEEDECPPIPGSDFDVEAVMPSAEFHKICKDMALLDADVIIQCLNNKLVFECCGKYSGRVITYSALEKDTDKYVKIKHSKQDPNTPLIVKQKYELKNIILFNKFAQLCQNIQIYMKNDFALVIRYTVATLGDILVCLSPKNDDNVKSVEDYYGDIYKT